MKVEFTLNGRPQTIDVAPQMPMRHLRLHPPRDSPRRGASREGRPGMSATVNVSRRGFLAAGGGLVLGFALPVRSLLAQRGGPPADIFAPPPEGKPNAYIHIGA